MQKCIKTTRKNINDIKKRHAKICKNERSFEKIQITVLNDEKAILGVFFNKPYIATLGRKKASKKAQSNRGFLKALFVFFIIFLTFWLLKRKKHVKLHKNTKSLENQKSFFENARSPLPPSDPPSHLSHLYLSFFGFTPLPKGTSPFLQFFS